MSPKKTPKYSGADGTCDGAITEVEGEEAAAEASVAEDLPESDGADGGIE